MALRSFATLCCLAALASFTACDESSPAASSGTSRGEDAGGRGSSRDSQDAVPDEPDAAADTNFDAAADDAAADDAAAAANADAADPDAGAVSEPEPGSESPPEGGPGCGFDAPAFCESFEDPAPGTGRAGEVAGERFSGSRLMPQLPTFDGPFPIATATTPSCREGLPSSIEPPQDFLLCDPSALVGSRHLLMVTAAQNYGQNSLRVRQPFDFGGRTGRVRVDAELWSPSLLYGFVSLAITTDPIGVPSFAIDQNYEGGALPPSGISFQFTNSICAGADSVALTSVIVYDDREQTIVTLTDSPCVRTSEGQLNPVELQLSASGVSVLAGSVSAGGDAPLELLTELALELPFSRGYVQLNVHNHASLKYSEGEAVPRDAWSARFDNLGFDGPRVRGPREYELPDSLERVEVGEWSAVGVGYYLPREGSEPLALPFDDLDLDGAARAQLAFNAWLLPFGLEQPVLLMRVNDGDVVERALTASEVNAVTSPVGQGAVSLVVSLPVADLVSGSNRVELWVRDVPMDYPPAIANVDLIVDPAP